MSDDTPLALARLVETSEAVGHPLTPTAAETLAQWAGLVIEWRRAAQLTSLRTVADVIGQLMVPALYALEVVAIREGMHIVDFGCGNGCTAVSLAMAAGRGSWHLVDRDEKKITFCRYALARCRIEETGAEVLAGDETGVGGSDVVLMRATPRSKDVLAAAEALLAPDGMLIRWLPEALRDQSGQVVRCGASNLWVVARRANVSRETLDE